jgi:hypothetical protein
LTCFEESRPDDFAGSRLVRVGFRFWLSDCVDEERRRPSGLLQGFSGLVNSEVRGGVGYSWEKIEPEPVKLVGAGVYA